MTKIDVFRGSAVLGRYLDPTHRLGRPASGNLTLLVEMGNRGGVTCSASRVASRPCATQSMTGRRNEDSGANRARREAITTC